MPPLANASRDSIANRIRSAIADRRLSVSSVAAAAGVDRRLLGRFLAGQRDILLANADRLAHALGLKLVEASTRKPARAVKPSPVALREVLDQASDELAGDQLGDQLAGEDLT